MQTHAKLPVELQGSFRVGDARALGVRVGRLRGNDLGRAFRGTRQREHPDTLLALCRAFEPNLRDDEMFCGFTAAWLWNVPLPGRFYAGDLHLAVVSPGRGRRAAGTVGHRIMHREGLRCTRFGLPVTDAATTWLALALVLPLNELVAAGDHLVHEPVYPVPGERRPYVALEVLRDRTASHSGRGKRFAAAAAPLLSACAESRPESLLRMLLREGGVPAPEVNPSIRDSQGHLLGRADLVFRAERLIVEYDGQQHRTDSAQYEKDAARLERFHLDDWHVIRVRKEGLFGHQHRTVTHVRDTLARLAESRGH